MKTPAVVLINPKFEHNVGAALRACSCWGAETLLWTGDRVVFDKETRKRIPREERMKGYKDVEWQGNVKRPLDHFRDAVPVCIEIGKGFTNLVHFQHPENPVYIFGQEDGSVPKVYRQLSHHHLFLPTHHCTNLSAAVNVVLYDRRAKRIHAGLEPDSLYDFLYEDRGEEASVSIAGWDGK